MRRYFVHTLLFLSLLTSSCGAAASARIPQPPALFAESRTDESSPKPASYGQNIRFEHFSLEEGLSQSTVNVILQDSKGFLWIGTEDGLNRYDGYNFKIYKPNEDDPGSLSDRWITSLAEDPQGNLWAGTRLGGLNRYDPASGKFTRLLSDSADSGSISHNHITALMADTTGIWIGTRNGLDFLDYASQEIEHYRTSSVNSNSLSSNWISTLFMDPHGNLWIGTQDSGLNFYDKASRSFQVFKHSDNMFTSLSSNRITSVLIDQQGGLWVGAANGLNYSETSGKYFTHYFNVPGDPESISGNSIHAIYQDSTSGIWIGTNNGLNRYDAEREAFVRHTHQPTTPNSLSNDAVVSIFEDKGNVMWIGTAGGGLNKYNRQQDHFAYYRTNPEDPNSLSGNFIMPIVVGEDGTAWVGAYGTGLNRLTPITNQFRRYVHDPNDPASLSTNEIIALKLDSVGNLWIGTTLGLDRLNTDTRQFTHFFPEPSNPDSLSAAPVNVIYEDHSGTIWVGTSRGLDQFDSQTATFINYGTDDTTPASFSDNQITSILEDKDLNFWIGTFDDGVKRFNPARGEIVSYTNKPDDPASLGSNAVLCLYLDHEGSLWIGTAGGGLNRYEPESDSFTRFTEKDGLPNDVIYGILEDRDGYLWASTNFGITRFDPETNTFRNFTASDGLQSNEFHQNAFAIDRNGNLYFGGINGFNIFSPDAIESSAAAPKIALTSLTQDRVPTSSEAPAESIREITLQWPQNSFEFEFAALSYEQPSKNQYAYTLENFESNWNMIGTQRNGRYTNLPGGAYTLRLLGSNSDGVWNTEGISIKVTVIPPIWDTWWFRSSSLLLLAAVIGVGYRWRVKRIESRNRELERLVQKRTGDLEKRTREIEALYQADERILRNVTLNQVFQTLVDVSVSMLKADRSVVFVWNEDQNKIIPRVSHGFRPETLYAFNFGYGEGLIGQTMKTGEPAIVMDVKPNTLRGDIETVLRKEGIQSFAHFPIVVDGNVIAIFNVAYTRPNAFNDDTVRLFTSLVNRAALSIANMQLFEQTKDLAVMEERNRLARDLHDSAKQKAFAALAQLGTVNGILNSKPMEARPHLTEAETLVFEVIQELTFLIQEIYPIALQEKGLPTTLREYIFEWESRNDTEVKLTIRNERPLPLEMEQAVYRVIQEALANVSRHSKAKRADVSLVYNIDSLQIMVADDGRGFDMNQRAKGMGFRSMRERINSVRGTIQIQSAPGQGTRLIAQLPIKQQGKEAGT